MSTDPLHNPETPRIDKPPDYGRDKPMVGSGEEAEDPKPFSLPPEAGKEGPGKVEGGDKPSPMDVAGEARQKPWTPQEMQSNMKHLHEQLDTAKTRVQDQKNVLSTDHEKALGTLTDKLNPDFKRIAQHTGQEYHPATRGKKQGIRDFVVNWVNGSQQTLTKSLDYLSTMKKPDPGAYLKIQMSVQRATQRGELFASIIGSSVSGIKTIMSTQLG